MLSMPITLGGAGTIDTQTFALTVNCSMGGAGSLTKTGTGVLTLSGANTFTGGTSVNAGALTLLGGAATRTPRSSRLRRVRLSTSTPARRLGRSTPAAALSSARVRF